MPSSACRSVDQLQDLRLDGDVERGGRLVGDQQRRPADQRHRDHRALAQAAGKLERIGVAARASDRGSRPAAASRRCSSRASGAVARRDGACSASPIWSPIVCSGDSEVIGSWKMIEMRPPRIAAHPAAVRVKLGDVDGLGRSSRVGEQDLAAGDPAGARQDAHDRLADHRLARSGFADQRHGAARPDPERDTAHRPDDALGNAEFDMQIADAQQISHWASLVGGSRVGNAPAREAVSVRFPRRCPGPGSC